MGYHFVTGHIIPFPPGHLDSPIPLRAQRGDDFKFNTESWTAAPRSARNATTSYNYFSLSWVLLPLKESLQVLEPVDVLLLLLVINVFWHERGQLRVDATISEVLLQ